ncbi:MAG: addiction module protein [Planctomycetes bacterium]|nr:addiction module protein [Planctomycetota bacterium]
MTRDALLHAALELPLKERARLAQDLLRSLDGPVDPGAEAAWTAEIERRARELDEGSVEPVDWKSAFERIAQRLRERRP